MRKRDEALCYCCIAGTSFVVKKLLDYGANANVCDERGYAPLHYACIDGHVSNVRLLLDHGADVNVRNKDGQTPFSIVLQRPVDNPPRPGRAPGSLPPVRPGTGNGGVLQP